jgi:dTDP-glucose 4,6-dehydratase
MIFVTGGAGFIGSNFIAHWLHSTGEAVLNLDALTYAGSLHNLAAVQGDSRHVFVHGSINDQPLVRQLLAQHRPRAVVHLAAHTHVDRSISGPGAFITANVDGTFQLLEATRSYWQNLGDSERTAFRFHHVSTDEVYGSLAPGAAPCDEQTPLAPSSPYSASKAASDHLVQAWHRTYGLPTTTSRCSNNYGPQQLPEKLIPLVITRALAGQPLPIYGDGLQRRDWLYVADHCSALQALLSHGVAGHTYNIGSGTEQANLDVVHHTCAVLDELAPSAAGPYSRLITHVADRPGHDRRYALSSHKLHQLTGWRPSHSWASGIRLTVAWYLANQARLNPVLPAQLSGTPPLAAAAQPVP